MSKLRLKLLLIMYKCNAGECRKKTVKAKTTYSDVGPGNCVLMTFLFGLEILQSARCCCFYKGDWVKHGGGVSRAGQSKSVTRGFQFFNCQAVV